MRTLVEVAEEYEDYATGIVAANDDAEIGMIDEPMQQISDAIHEGIEATLNATGIDVTNTEVKDLPGNTAGEYHLSSKAIKADAAVIESGDAALIKHVLIHEAWHKENKAANDDEIIQDTYLEEALTERATERTTGQIIAYHEHLHLVDDVAASSEQTRGQIIDLFEAGRNADINELYNQAFPKAA